MQEISIELPDNVENLQLPSPELVTYYNNLSRRVLWLDAEVDKCWLEYARNIIDWNREDKGKAIEKRKPIRLMFFSYGGSLDVNNAFIDIIKMSQTPIIGINIGQACSAGCFIYIACHKRLALPHSTFLIHQGSGDGFSGSPEQVLSAVMEYQRNIDDLSEYLLANTKISQEVLDERITTEWYLPAEDALEYGVCDQIVNSIDEIL